MFCPACYCNFQVVLGDLAEACPFCQQQINHREVTDKVQGLFMRELTLWQVQDLYCKKCSRIRRDPLDPQCTCGGQFIYRARLDFSWLNYHQPSEIMADLL
jgi:hypothetical protein